MMDGDVHVADYASRLDPELRDEEIVDADAVFLAQEQLRPDFGRVSPRSIHPRAL